MFRCCCTHSQKISHVICNSMSEDREVWLIAHIHDSASITYTRDYNNQNVAIVLILQQCRFFEVVLSLILVHFRCFVHSYMYKHTIKTI